MYAVIRAGGKQYKVAEGDVIEIERLKDPAEKVTFEPLLVVDDKGKARVGSGQLSGASVSAEVIGEVKGVKVDVYKYKNKTRYRRHTGHRQRYTSIRIAGIALGGGSADRKSQAPAAEVKTDGT